MAVNPAGLWQIPTEDRKRLEEMGEAYVRQHSNGGVHPKEWEGTPDSFKAAAVVWLAELEENQQRQQMWLSKSAAYGAIGAVVVGIIGIVVAIILWRFPRH